MVHTFSFPLSLLLLRTALVGAHDLHGHHHHHDEEEHGRNLRKGVPNINFPDQSITIGGIKYASRDDFIKAGKRCGQRDMPVAEQMEVDANIKAALKSSTVSSIPNIGVYFHVIRSSTGTNGVSTQQINDQITVLNNAFSGVFTFSLLQTTTTNHATWSTMGHGSTAESEAKNALRQGSARHLNIYTANIGKF
jgi:hypothetical protein